MTDSVNNPSHYASGAIECIDAMESMLSRDEFIGYLRGNIFKYQWRYKHKNGLEDLKKAEWYQRKLIEVEGRVSVPKAILEAEKYQPNYAGPVHE